MTLFVSYVVVLIVAVGAALTLFGWKWWLKQSADLSAQGWRTKATFVALVCASASALLLVGYLVHNIAIGGDRSRSASTLLCIRSGNYLCVAAILFSLFGRGQARWAAMLGACFIMFIWLSEGMST
jgi:hypothetical protein